MSEWAARRFWTAAETEAVGPDWTVRLDGRPVKTPAGTPILMPTEGLARAVAAEWQAQGQTIDPLSMPVMRAVNATLDKVMPQKAAVTADLAGYGGSDLLCYRAAGPDALVARQIAAWDEMLDWADERFGTRLAVTQGVIPVAQPANALEVLRARVEAASPWEVTALSEFVTLSGSLILGLAALERARSPEDLWARSRVDEDWQAERWGADDEEGARVAVKREAFLQADRYLTLVSDA